MTDSPPPSQWWQQPQGAPQVPPPGGQPFPGAPQPGYSQVGYGYSAGGPASYQSLSGVSVAVIVLLAVAGVGAALLAASLASRATVIADGSLTFSEAVAADDRVAGSLVLYALATLAAGILWMIWQFRHAKNAVALGGYDGPSPGWAIGGWFLPIGNLFLPEAQLLAASKVSDPTGARRAPGVIVAWWVAYIGAGVVSVIGTLQRPSTTGFGPVSIEDFQQADRIQGLGYLVAVVAAVLAIVTVRTCTARQQAAFRARGVPV